MRTIASLFSAFWPTFLCSFVGMAIEWLLRSGARNPFVGPKDFVEPAGLPAAERSRLRDAAMRAAFRHGGWWRPVLLLALLFGAGASLQEIATVAGGWRLELPVGLLFCGAGILSARALTRRRVRPLLEAGLQQLRNAT